MLKQKQEHSETSKTHQRYIKKKSNITRNTYQNNSKGQQPSNIFKIANNNTNSKHSKSNKSKHNTNTKKNTSIAKGTTSTNQNQSIATIIQIRLTTKKQERI